MQHSHQNIADKTTQGTLRPRDRVSSARAEGDLQFAEQAAKEEEAAEEEAAAEKAAESTDEPKKKSRKKAGEAWKELSAKDIRAMGVQECRKHLSAGKCAFDYLIHDENDAACLVTLLLQLARY